MIEISGVVKNLNGNIVLRGVDLKIEKGSTCVIIGRSGCGKSVLLKQIVGLLLPDSGQVILDGKDVIYVQGGNTFYLLKHVRESGFDVVVKDLIEKGVIYIGVSAGSYIACPTIEMTAWKSSDDDYYGVTDLTAMNLVPFLVCVHYNREKYREGLIEGIKTSKYPVKILTDEQALLIRNGEVKLIGSGEEVKFPA